MTAERLDDESIDAIVSQLEADAPVKKMTRAALVTIRAQIEGDPTLSPVAIAAGLKIAAAIMCRVYAGELVEKIAEAQRAERRARADLN